MKSTRNDDRGTRGRICFDLNGEFIGYEQWSHVPRVGEAVTIGEFPREQTLRVRLVQYFSTPKDPPMQMQKITVYLETGG